MAQIEIQDDWDKPQNNIRIKSADPNDLHEAVTAGLQSAGFATCGQCEDCGGYGATTYYRCSGCGGTFESPDSGKTLNVKKETRP